MSNRHLIEPDEALNKYKNLKIEVGNLLIRFDLIERIDYYPNRRILELRAYPYYYGRPGEPQAWSFVLDEWMGRHNIADQMEGMIHRGMLELLRVCAQDKHYMARQRGEYLEQALTATEVIKKRERL